MSFGKVKNNFYPFGEFPDDNEVAAIGFPLLTKDPDVDVSINITIGIPAGNSVTVLWGDGNEDTVVGPQAGQVVNNVYADALATYGIRIVGNVEAVTRFICQNEPVSGDFNNFGIFTGLANIFDLSQTAITGNGSLLGGITLVTQLSIDTSTIAPTMAEISGMTNLVLFYCNLSLANGDIADLKTLVNMTELRLFSSAVSNYTQGVLPNWDAANLNIRSLGLTQQMVDDFMVDLNNSSIASIKTLQIHGTNAAPSAVGVAAAAALTVKGWTVIHT